MALRPIFFAISSATSFVRTIDVEFKWHAGMSVSQKQKSISSLHESAKSKGLSENMLEISSKSESPLGVKLSAFNLNFEKHEWNFGCVETAFQGSKVFECGGPYRDLYTGTARDAKKDVRLQNSGKLVTFRFMEKDWPLRPQTLFYDWLYLNALVQNPDLADSISNYDCFTDIEFNPKKSINCQAFSAALYVSLRKESMLAEAMESPDNFQKLVEARIGVEGNQQGSLLAYPLDAHTH